MQSLNDASDRRVTSLNAFSERPLFGNHTKAERSRRSSSWCDFWIIAEPAVAVDDHDNAAVSPSSVAVNSAGAVASASWCRWTR
jgi:hypothetical protein